ncbi:MAG: BMP family protein [Candidatus Thorarchaeota archaeon]
MDKKRIILSAFFISLFIMGSFALASTIAHAREAQTEKQIAVVFSTGSILDKSFNQAAFNGLERAISDFSFNVSYVDPQTETEINTALESYASDAKWDLIIAIGFTASSGVNTSAYNHPLEHFMIIDSVVDQPNVQSIVFREHEGSFLVGAMAAMVTQTNKLGFIGGLDIDLINRFAAGFKEGAEYVNPNVQVGIQYIGGNNPWVEVSTAKTIANSFLTNGSDIIFAAAGGAGEGVFSAIEDARANGETAYAIGVDSNQDSYSQGNILTSMVKRVDNAVYDTIGTVIDDTWAPTVTSLGLNTSGVGMTSMDYTQAEKNAVCYQGKSNYDVVQEFKQDIIDGSIQVNPFLNYTKNTVGHPTASGCDGSATPVSGQSSSAPVTQTTTVEKTITASGFEIFALMFGLGTLVVTIKSRKR